MMEDSLLIRADEYRGTLLSLADGHEGSFPWWHGWAIAEAWLTGYQAGSIDLARLQAAIRHHRDQRGDDRCFLDDDTLYAALPEGYTPPTRDSCVELKRCKAYIASRHNPATTYVSPQTMIDQLEIIAVWRDGSISADQAAAILGITPNSLDQFFWEIRDRVQARCQKQEAP